MCFFHKKLKIVRAMKKGIHVLCEKPISLKEEDVRMLYDAAEKNNVFFMVAHVIRFWPEYMKLKEIHDSGKYGKLLSGSMKRLSAKPKWSWDNWMSDPERSGMVPYDLHIHDLDFMMYTFGNPTKVVPYRVNRPEQDYLQVIYEYDNFFISAESFRIAFNSRSFKNSDCGFLIRSKSSNTTTFAIVARKKHSISSKCLLNTDAFSENSMDVL